MAGFYRGNSDEVIAAPCRVLIAPSTYPHPTQLSHIINLSTYDPNITYGWQDLGVTGAPTRVSIGADAQKLSNQQFGQFRTVPTDFHGQVVSEFLQVSQDKKALLIPLAVKQADTPGGEKLTDYTSVASFPTVRLALLFKDHNNKAHAIYMPKCQWGGQDIEQQIGRGEMIRIPMTWDAYPDDTLLDPTNGEPVIRRDFDQV